MIFLRISIPIKKNIGAAWVRFGWKSATALRGVQNKHTKKKQERSIRVVHVPSVWCLSFLHSLATPNSTKTNELPTSTLQTQQQKNENKDSVLMLFDGLMRRDYFNFYCLRSRYNVADVDTMLIVATLVIWHLMNGFDICALTTDVSEFSIRRVCVWLRRRTHLLPCILRSCDMLRTTLSAFSGIGVLQNRQTLLVELFFFVFFSFSFLSLPLFSRRRHFSRC